MVEMLGNIFMIKGYSGGFAYFWTSPVGFVVCLILFLSSIYNVYAKKLCIVYSLYEYVIAFLAASSMLHVYENTVPKHQMITVVLTLAAKRLYDAYRSCRGAD